MGLVTEQDAFLADLVKLLSRARDMGFIVTGGELFRTPEQQQIHIRAGRSKTMNSQHLKRLAIDLNFFIVGGNGKLTLTYDVDDLKPLGDYWESLSPANRWGGNWKSFKDTPHFERREGVASPGAAPAPVSEPELAGTEAPTAPLTTIAFSADARARRLLSGPVGFKKSNRKSDVVAVQRMLNEAAAQNLFLLDAALKPDGIFGKKTLKGISDFQSTVVGLASPDGTVDPGGTTLNRMCAVLPPGFSRLGLGLIFSRASKEDLDTFFEPMKQCFERFEINTPLRQVHFIAQVGHECAELRFQEEIASGAAYEGRTKLGNTQAGDGKRFKGRGLIQLTGRFNYTKFSEFMQRPDLLDAPRQVADDPDLCVLAAGWYWHDRKLNALADADDLRQTTKKINGGFNGIDDRRRLLTRAKAVYGL